MNLYKYINKIMSKKIINDYEIDMNKPISRDDNGITYQCVKKGTNHKMLAKMISRQKIDYNSSFKNALLANIYMRMTVKHPNLLQIYQQLQSPQYFYIIHQKYTNNLKEYINQNQQKEQTAVQLLRQIVRGFIPLVQINFIHTGITPFSIVMLKEQVKIGGIMEFIDKNDNQTADNKIARMSYPCFLPPQIYQNHVPNSKCDIWSIGCILFMMLHPQAPVFSKKYPLFKQVEKNKLLFDDNLSNNTKDFLRRCLTLDQKKRISWEQVLKHPIFNGQFSKINLKQVQKQKSGSKKINLGDVFRILQLSPQKQYMVANTAQFHMFLTAFLPNITKQESSVLFQKIPAAEGKESSSKFKDNHQQFMNKVRMWIQNLKILIQQKAQGIPFQDAIDVVLKNQELREFNSTNFYKFINHISPTLEQNDIQTLFDLVNVNKAEKIQIKEFAEFCQNISNQGQKLKQRIAKIFRTIIPKSNSSNSSNSKIKQMFQLSTSNNKMNFSQFKTMMMDKKVDQTFTEADLRTIFTFISKSQSNSIEFQQFRSFYNQISNIENLQ